MWKLVVAFVVIAALGIWLLTKGGGDIDMGGEKHETSSHAPAEKEKTPSKP